MSINNYKTIIFSDVSSRDGIGIEVYFHNDLILEIFRNDLKKTIDVTMFKQNISLNVVEESINIFRKKINLDFNSSEDP